MFIVAFSTILDRMSDRNARSSIPDKAWPNDTYSVPQKNLSFNGEAIQIFHQPATTDGDSIVATEYGIPLEAALGGSETLYPEYIKKMKTMKVAPRTTTEHHRRTQ